MFYKKNIVLQGKKLISLIRKNGFRGSFNKFLQLRKQYGIIPSIKYIIKKLQNNHLNQLASSPNDQSDQLLLNKINEGLERNDLQRVKGIFDLIKEMLACNIAKGIIFLDSAFDFDPNRNQRPIALAKGFLQEGYIVCLIRYQWNRKDVSKADFGVFYGKVFQIPKYTFIDYLKKNQIDLLLSTKLFIINIPDQDKLELFPLLRKNSFSICYDIMDFWEGFHKEGMAIWYTPEVEKFSILNSDFVTAVSPALVDMFSHIRKVYLVSNGVWGKGMDLNSSKIKKENNTYHIGYFGHLTEKWFDWNLIIKLANDKRFFIHIIGEGISPIILDEIKKIENIKYYGYIPKPDLKEVISAFQVGIIPFIPGVLSNSVDPLKVYEYLQYGIPTVSTGIPHLNNYPYCKNVESFNEFKDTLIEMNNSLLISGLDGEIVDNFLLEHNWINKCNTFIQLANNNEHLSKLYRV